MKKYDLYFIIKLIIKKNNAEIFQMQPRKPRF